MSLRDTILQAQDIEQERVSVPEWGITVTIRGMTAGERDDFEASWFTDDAKPKRNLANVRARLAVRCMLDDEGKRIFSDQDAEALGRKSGRAMDRVYAVASRLSGLGAKDAEELAKN